MKMDDNQKKNNNKITPFPSQEERETDKEFDALFKERLLSDADAYEKELNENPDLADVKAPDDLFERIVGELKEKNIWEEDDENVSNGNTEWIDKREELTKDEIYNLLSDDDRAALELGLKVQGRKKWKRVVKYASMAVAIFVGVFLISMSSDANRAYMIGVINSVFGSNIRVSINGGKDTVKSHVEGKEAYEDIYNKLGIQAPIFRYKPEGMEYIDYDVNCDTGSAALFYEYEEFITTVYVFKNTDQSVRNHFFDGEIVDKAIVELNDQKVDIWEIKSEDNKNGYATQFQYKNIYYSIWGKMNKEDFKKMINNIYF